ncbi:DUF1840 domain-containing protein [Rheinheimera salexigens]|uniref:DUF1840 domain-containing protein n=1 Tax=Rheinheimera salexigens TaxID=1628148 RepID=A0A1E7Q5P1_9GAMM|nr:DUF1840 domain-containing protein [Rheinheimera salexigens]OEY69456.1 hypothetical protein BI198_07665 [Rheinheimera salexigens]
MIVTFKSKAGSDTAYFKNIALKLLMMMGRDDKVPSAFYAEDVPAALQSLQQALAKLKQEQQQEQPQEDEADINQQQVKSEHVSIETRAQPLITLLTKAVKKQESVFWE